VAFDEQIFAIQAYGGISRMFAELAEQFVLEPELDVELLPLNAPIINRYALDHEELRTRLAVWDAGHEYRSLARYFMRIRPRRHQAIVHNTFYLPHGLASYPGARRVVTVHDMIPELLPHTRRRLDFLTMKKRYIESAHHIVCVSEATKQDLLAVYPHVHAPISVIHHGVGARFTPRAPRLPELPANYILFVGNRAQYKDADVLLRAFAEVHRGHPDLTLLLVGGGALQRSEIEILRNLKISEAVQHMNVADADMASVYSHAEVFVFPSRFEGFGIPVLEAMACGTPTLLARATSLPEVGGDVARYFAPGDSNDLAVALTEIIEDASLQEDMRSGGLTRAARFTWHKAAVAHIEAYREALTA